MILNFNKQEIDSCNFYDLSDVSANEAAKKKGMVVVYPKDNEIMIDIDSEEAYKEYNHRFEKMWDGGYENQLIIEDIKEIPSSSGLPNRHIYITFRNKIFTAMERIWLQSILGSDPVRELLDSKRLLMGIEKPTRFFEKP